MVVVVVAMASSKGAPVAASLFITLQLIFLLIELAVLPTSAFTVPSALTTRISVLIPPLPHARGGVVVQQRPSELYSTENDNGNNNLGVIDLTEDDDDNYGNDSSSPTNTAPQQTQTAPFLSQGELSTDPNLLSPDFNDAKQTRVIIYIILTLLPVLFLVPLMIGSRDLIPLDALPPVELN